jgi:16S rRNA (guanine527-N7)-methyltransferase
MELYFPNLDETQLSRFEQLGPLYQDWNQKINLISRKDIEFIYDHHILHSLAISGVLTFLPGAEVLDIGTGGGFPGIPLAILFPETRFTLIDGTGKKIMVVQEIANALQLENVTAQHIRAEELKGQNFDFVVSRAVAELPCSPPGAFASSKTSSNTPSPTGLLRSKAAM